MTTGHKQVGKRECKLMGIGIAPGIAIGPAFIIEQSGVPVTEYAITVAHVEKELKRLHGAIAKVQKHLAQVRQKAEKLQAGAEDMLLLLDAYRGMLSGSRLVRGVEEIIKTQHINAEAAIQKQITTLKAGFAAMSDPYLAARAQDVGEVGTRLIRALLQQNYNPFASAPEGCVILAEEITPADTALMTAGRVAGFATVLGGAEGHAAIMARALGVPAISGVAALTHGLKTGEVVVIDGRKGEIFINPSPETLKYYRGELANKRAVDKRLAALRDIPAVTRDGTPISLQANLELPRDAAQALASGATGVGLLRTEFMFMNRPDLPNEDEQYELLRDLMRDMQGRPVTVRTLDVGGEKLAAAIGGASEESSNPALGLRAIRYGLKNPEILETQITAILRAGLHGPVRILLPMISSASQVRLVRDMMRSAEKALARRGIVLNGLPPLGAMIEIPSAALTADALAKECDFFSIGSNDLTQYTLAIDRGDDSVADLYDPFHPAVLRLIRYTARAGARAGIPVSLCGEIAGDRRATRLLLGLGLRELSMSPLRLPAVKDEIVGMSMDQAHEFCAAVLREWDEAAINDMIRAAAKTGRRNKTKKA